MVAAGEIERKNLPAKTNYNIRLSAFALRRKSNECDLSLIPSGGKS
jgi:hypothetical protein